MSAIDDVTEADRRRIRAMLNKDVGALQQLLASDLVYTHANGKKDNRESLIAAMLSGAAAYRRIEPTYTDIRDFGGTVALAGEAEVTVSSYGERRLSAIRFTALWVQSDSGWQLAIWQSTKTTP